MGERKVAKESLLQDAMDNGGEGKRKGKRKICNKGAWEFESLVVVRGGRLIRYGGRARTAVAAANTHHSVRSAR